MPASKLIHHLRNYASAGVLSAVVGLVSFPLMTRSLSVADYGIVGLITSSVTLFIAIGKLGVQHAVIRFFAQIKNANIAFSSEELYSTVSAVFLALAAGATVLFLLAGFQLLPEFLQYEDISSLFLLAAPIVFVRILGSGVMNFLRAEQRSAEVAIAQSLARFSNLLFIIAVLLLGVLDPHSVIVCLFFAEFMGVCFVVYQYRNQFYFKRVDVSGKLSKAMLMYGMPLMILESLSLVLRLSDRYLIEAMLGVDELGQYSASYNLTSYLDLIVLAAMLQAIRPAYMQIWESKGPEETKRFLTRIFHLYVVVGIPFIAMFAVTTPYILSFLAGPKYALGTVIIPFVALSFWLEGAMNLLAAGLYIFKNTKVLMYTSLCATVLNLGLNFLLIPRFGISGAAAVTVFCYTVFLAVVTLFAFKHVSFKVEFKKPLLISIASLGVFMFLKQLDFATDVHNFFYKGIGGTVVLSAAIWLLVPDVRPWVTKVPLPWRTGRKA